MQVVIGQDTLRVSARHRQDSILLPSLPHSSFPSSPPLLLLLLLFPPQVSSKSSSTPRREGNRGREQGGEVGREGGREGGIGAIDLQEGVEDGELGGAQLGQVPAHAVELSWEGGREGGREGGVGVRCWMYRHRTQ